jgi:hypothetical protein
MNDIPVVYKRTIPEAKVTGYRLGRHVEHDPRSLAYPADTVTPADVTHNAHGLPLDQLRGSCTAEALCGACDSDPNFKGVVATQADADLLYNAEIIAEGGNPATDDPGGTGLLVCKVAKLQGLITRYHHCFGLNHLLGTLIIRPVMIGVDWYDSFDSPDSKGIISISPDAIIRGGHEFVLDELQLENKLLGAWQSWGEWGLGGRFYLSFDTTDTLIEQQCDVTVPIV